MVSLLLSLNLFSTPLYSIPSGNWATDCVSGVERRQSYVSNFVRTEETFFTALNCEQPNVRFITTGHVSALTPDPQSEHRKINFTYQQVDLSLHRAELVSHFNQRRVCGFSDWQLNEPKEITGLNCELFQTGTVTRVAAAGDRRYGIYAIEGDRLYYGQLSISTDGSSEDKRPKVLNRTIVYTFQSSL